MDTTSTGIAMGGRVPLDEAATVTAAQRGDRAAFGRLVRTYQRRAYAAAYDLVRNRDDALDLAQESFARAYRAMGRFDTQMPFYPWLYRIIRNTCLNHLKKRQRHGETSLDGLMESGFDARDQGRTPTHQAELEDLRRAVQEAMTHLNPEHREILRLRHFLEMSYHEIAQYLGIPAGTVMSRLYAARQSLRQEIESKGLDQSTAETVPAGAGTAGRWTGA
jgi:RNA polymerase sigma-70 factor (ECF subfamily)